jgi:DMSO/TMAO reductase YedYZ molybdopterin-dependent catalytic subunit
MRRFGRGGIGALVGLLSAAVALGVGETVAAFVRPTAAPVIAVGNRFIALTPESVKRWAIRNFGTNDKNALLSGIYLFLALFAVAVGILALRRLAYGIAGVVGFGLIGSYAALTARAHHVSDVVPTIFGTAAGVAVMILLTRAAGNDGLLSQPDSGGGAADSGGGTADPGGWVPPRRRFIQASAATAGLAALTGFGGRAAQHARFDVAAVRAKVRLPTAVETAPTLPSGVDLGKSQVPWQTPNASFYRIDTALSVPQIDPNTWSLRIHGMVDREVTLTYADLTARPLIERWITLCCVSNVVGGGLISNARFLGARLPDILNLAGVHPAADQLVMSSPDGMTIGAPTAVVMDGRDAMIAIGMNGVPLPVEHGFPARVVVPGLYGYVSACKWVVDIEATTYSAKVAYWAQGGWDAKTDIKLQSRIDTPHNGGKVAVGQPVAVAGIAWDQHVGVSKVEVQVNNGEWLPTRLATVPSTDTWRQWVLAWTPTAPGSYTLRVRATDAAGSVQTAQVADVFPRGATGLHTISVHAR